LIRNDDKDWNHARSSEITPLGVYQDRRQWIRQLAAGTAGVGLTSWAGRDALAQGATARPGKLPALPASISKVAGAVTMEKPTTYQDASTYNNFYEFWYRQGRPRAQQQPVPNQSMERGG